MRTIGLIILLTCLSGVAAAEDYTLGFFTDEDASSCEITNVTGEVITIHMLLYGDATTANTVSFYASTPACWDAIWLGDEINDDYLPMGTTHGQYGVSITFRGCRDLPLRLGSMSFWATGSSACCTYDAYRLPLGNVDYIEVINCGSISVPAGYESVVINPDESCGCAPSAVVSTEETTWGRVKALYSR
jgi:hypothetical protein